MRSVATVISYVFHPLLFATYLVFLLGWFMPRFLLISPAALLTFAALIFTMTFIFPISQLYMLKAFGSLPSIHMKTRQERVLPFTLISIIYSVVAILFFVKFKYTVNFNKVMFLVAALVIAATAVTFFYKISIHSLAVCGAVGIIIPLNKAMGGSDLLLPTVAILVIAGAVMSARLYLNAHTPREVMYGAVLGFSIGFFGMLVLF